MSITKAIHIQCNACGRWLRDASYGTYANQQAAISLATLKGWTHGTRDLCPICIVAQINAREAESLETLRREAEENTPC